ncbi:MAG: YbhB/YbcL family Raf kinase inhibitor-like protein [Anaerolineaceae bacterium]
MEILTGFILAAVISAAAFFARSLTISGTLAAVILGTVVFGLGGLSWAALLLAFFVTSSLLSHFFKQRKAAVDEKFSKGSRRDLWQVSANGLIAGLVVLAHLVFPDAFWPWLAFAGSLAAVNADTWATEIGILGRGSPRLITSGKIVDRGTSGGVSLPGTLAAAGGAVLIGLLAAVFWQGPVPLVFPSEIIIVILIITLAGLAGSLVDSLLGATWQALYFCPACRKETERHPLHTCGSATTHLRGLPWLNNDFVNGACSLSGALLAAVAGILLISPAPLVIGETRMADIQISSSVFQNGAVIPQKYSCDGENLSPVLQWSGLPEGAKSLALIADDPDAPIGTFTHWVVYNMTTDLTGIPEGTPKTGEVVGLGTQGSNSYGRVGYDGPCPPRGQSHRYFFKLYALDLPTDLPAGLESAGLQRAMQGHILAQGQWMGTFKR